MARPAYTRPTKKQPLQRQREGGAHTTHLLPAAKSLRTGRRQGVGQSAADLKAYPPQPEDWPGTEPEWAIYWAHGKLGLIEGEDFAYRLLASGSSLRQATGGVEIDFFEYGLNIGIDVQGFFAHYKLGADKQAADIETLIDLESHGIDLIRIDDKDAQADPIFYLKEARNGIDHSLAGRGLV